MQVEAALSRTIRRIRGDSQMTRGQMLREFGDETEVDDMIAHLTKEGLWESNPNAPDSVACRMYTVNEGIRNSWQDKHKSGRALVADGNLGEGALNTLQPQFAADALPEAFGQRPNPDLRITTPLNLVSVGDRGLLFAGPGYTVWSFWSFWSWTLCRRSGCSAVGGIGGIAVGGIGGKLAKLGGTDPHTKEGS